MLRNRTSIYRQFDAQNAGNSVSELPDFKFFWGGMPPDPHSKRGLAAPCQYPRLLFSNWLPTSNFIETPGDFNGKVLTNVIVKKLTEQLGLRGHQEHHNAYVEDLVIRQQEDGTEVVEFREGPTKTRSGGLSIRRRTTPQVMYSTNDGKTDPVRLHKLWFKGMKETGPLYVSVINRPQSPDVWCTKIRMGQNTIGNIMKSMASCLKTNKKLTNHSMRKTLVSKLKNSGQPRNVICEITGHARECSLDDYDEINKNQRKELSHIISGYKEVQNEKSPNKVSNQTSANEASNDQALAVQRQ